MKAVCRLASLSFVACALLAAAGCKPASKTEVARPAPPPAPVARMQSAEDAASVQKWCRDLRVAITGLHWKLDPCTGFDWVIGGWSVEKRPLIYAEFGDPSSRNTTLILSSVHGDEVTPLYLGGMLVHWLKDHPAILGHSHVVVVPLVNPDGFYHHPRHRTNGHRVDVNRNFPTADWSGNALQAWKNKFGSNPRRYPGPRAGSEPETVFQQELIKKFSPQKILSIHSPLNFTDYDGPSQLSLAKFPSEYVEECLKLRNRLKATSTGFFPGSLGNYAGQELGIPTITLELPTADPKMADVYWQQFQKGIQTMIEYVVPPVTLSLPSRGEKVAGR